MSTLRRHYEWGTVYFVTAVTYGRSSILVQNADLLLLAMERLEETDGVDILAWVIMPDHIHAAIETGQENLS